VMIDEPGLMSGAAEVTRVSPALAAPLDIALDAGVPVRIAASLAVAV
jgi:hypothetical protein